ncbi:MAG: OmpA family protein [Myxococcales bacterium]|nr:OmpA family protein [Myxococcales bacterium]
MRCRVQPWVVAMLACAGVAAGAPRIDVGVEGGAALAVGAASSTFGPGGSIAVRGRVHLVGPLQVQAGGGYLSMSGRDQDSLPGGALWGGAGARLALLEGAPGSLWSHLWLDAQADVTGTGSDVRFAWEAGLGAQLKPVWPVGFGPFVRFMHIVDAPGPTAADAFVFTAGLFVSLGAFPEPKPVLEPEQPRDADGDGVPDDADRCPDLAESVNGFEDGDGCPDVTPAAPNETTTRIEIKKPGSSDRDGDGFIDERDTCPDVAEVFNGVDDTDGCADAGPSLVTLTAERLTFASPIKFEKVKGAWRPVKAALPMLSAAAVVLSLHPEVRSVRIEARAEKQATREATAALAQKRAEAIRSALVELGLDDARLEAVAAPDVAASKDRVEFLLVR